MPADHEDNALDRLTESSERGTTDQPPRRSLLRRLLGRRAMYPNEYVWFVFVSAMDVFMTTIVLHLGGREVNPIADAVLVVGGLRGMFLFKFVLVLVILTACQIIGEQRYRTGKILVRAAVGITAIPMIVAFAQLLAAVW